MKLQQNCVNHKFYPKSFFSLFSQVLHDIFMVFIFLNLRDLLYLQGVQMIFSLLSLFCTLKNLNLAENLKKKSWTLRGLWGSVFPTLAHNMLLAESVT